MHNNIKNTGQIEQTVLGSIIHYPKLHADYIGALWEDCFSTDARRAIYKAVSDCFSTYGSDYTPELVNSRISSTESYQSEWLSIILSGKADAPMKDYVGLLLDSAKERFLHTEITSALKGENVSSDVLREIANTADERYSDIALRDNDDITDRYIKGLDQPKNLLFSKFAVLDKHIGGLQEGTLTVIGARPSVGKTTFSLNIAQNIAAYGKRVMFFSLEMTSEQIMNRLVSRGSNLDYKSIQQSVTQEQKETIQRYLNESGIMKNLSIRDDLNTVEGICNAIAMAKPDVAVIDYAQIVRSARGNAFEPRLLLNYVSGTIKETAKRNGTRVVLLSQLRRLDSSMKKYRYPTMSDLKESGALEQDADYVMLIARPFAEMAKSDKMTYTPADTSVLLDKNRFGTAGRIPMCFDGAHQTFREKGVVSIK